MTTATAEPTTVPVQPQQRSQPPRKRLLRFRLLRGLHVQKGRPLRADRNHNIQANEWEMVTYRPGDVFECEEDLSYLDKNSPDKKYEKVHPATPLHKAKPGENPLDPSQKAQQWNPDQEATQAPGETLDMFILRLQNIKRMREEGELADVPPLNMADLDEARDRAVHANRPFDPSRYDVSPEPKASPDVGNGEPYGPDLETVHNNQPNLSGTSPEAVAKAVRAGYDTINTPRSMPQNDGERFATLDSMTNGQLKEFAREMQVELGRATRHEDMVKVLMAATEPVED